MKTVDFSKNQTLLDVDVLIVAGPKRDLLPRDIFEIDQYLLGGGKAIFLVDAVEQVEGGITINNLETNVQKLLEPFGIVVESNLLLDSSSELANFNEGNGRFFFLQYPPFIRLVSQNFSKNPIIAKIPSFVVRFVSAITITEQSGLTYDRLVNSTAGSWVLQSPYNVNPTSITPPAQDQLASRTFAVSVSGLLPRISQENAVPPLQQWEKSLPTPEKPDGDYVATPVKKDDNRQRDEIISEAKAEAKIIVFSDSDFVGDQMIQQDQTPLIVFQNAVDSFTFGEKLISIRSKSLGQVPIKDFDPGTKSLMKFLGILLVPILLSFYGIVRLWVRRKEERLLKL